MYSPTVQPTDNLTLSRLALGCWRLHEWNYSAQELMSFIDSVVDMGITTFDHADIYGDYTCETLFGKAVSRRSSLKDKIRIVTKCGIMPPSAKFPDRKVKHYDYSTQHIVESTERSLQRLEVDRIDVLLLHRPSPLLNPAEVAEAFRLLRETGKVRHFGVSNFAPDEVDTLQAFLDDKLIINQIEISPLCLEHFENGNMNHALRTGITPMAWSPLAGGAIFKPKSDLGFAMNRTLGKVGEEIGATTVAQVALSWLLHHPSNIIPILGSGKRERIQESLKALHMPLTKEQWFAIYSTAIGRRVP